MCVAFQYRGNFIITKISLRITPQGGEAWNHKKEIIILKAITPPRK